MSGALFDEMWDGEGGSGSPYSNVTEPSSNATLSCAARSIQGPVMLPYSTALTTTVRVILAMYYIITTLAGIILNTLVIVLVAKYKKLRTHSFAVALQVVGLDLVRCLVFLAGQINVVANRWVFGKFVCDMTGVLVETITHVHLHLMFVLVLDRYLSTFYRSFYLKHGVKVCVSVSITTWLFAVLSYAPLPPALSDCVAFDRFKWVCAHSSSCKSACFDRLAVTLVIQLIRGTTYFLMYSRLFYKARKNRRVEESQAPGSPAAQDLRQKEHRTSVTFFWLFIVAHLCTLPSYIIIAMVELISSGLSGELPVELYLMAVCSYTVPALLSVIDPLLLMRNQDLRTTMSDRAIRRQPPHARSASMNCDNALFEVIENPAVVGE